MTLTAEDALHQLRFTNAGRIDPYPLYRALLEHGPLHRSGEDGIWCAVGYRTCRQLLLDPRLGHCGQRVSRRDLSHAELRRLERRFEFQRRVGLTKLNLDPPENTRMRRLLGSGLTPGRLAGLRTSVIGIVDGCLDRIAGMGDADLMVDLGLPLSVGVVGDLVGIPREEQDRFRRPFIHGGDLVYGVDPGDEDLDRAEATLQELESVLQDVIADRRRHPRQDLISDLLAVDEDGDRLPERDIMAMALVLFLAGFVTTTNLIGNGLLALFRHPEEMARLWGDASLVASAVEEMLRWDTPFQWVTRRVLEPADVDGERLQVGDMVVVFLGAANRDAERFPQPDRFDVARPDNKPLAFGWGIHYCLGAALARMEGQMVFGHMRERFWPELLDENPPAAHSPMSGAVRGVRSLPVRVHPVASRLAAATRRGS
ncbi:MAG TPA: cytochrome P450 [Acidimicrobiales bacterium]|nr:cytochrome P450 [Acidimicrobiales bacterium]